MSSENDKQRVGISKKLHQEQAAVRRVLPEDIAEAGRIVAGPRYDYAVARLLDRPNCVLARGSATKVRADDQHRTALGIGFVERIIRAAHVMEQQFSVPCARDTREKPRRNDPVGIDVVPGVNRDATCVDAKSWHQELL